MKKLRFAEGKDARAIDLIVDRAVEMAESKEIPLDKHRLHMDISAVHANGCPLELDRLLKADDFNFTHDVFGIMRHINRKTGKLTGFFLPRCKALIKKC